MEKYIEFFEELGLPFWIVVGLMLIFGIMQCIGEFLEFKGKVVPEFMKIRKKIARRKLEKEAMKKAPEALEKATAALNEINMHYNADNIRMRDKWMQGMNSSVDEIHQWMQAMDGKMDKNNAEVLKIRIENMRSTIIDFASYVSKEKNPVTREQFNRVFKIYEEYEEIIAANGLTNGEVDIAIHIIRGSYEKHLIERTFIEDTWVS